MLKKLGDFFDGRELASIDQKVVREWRTRRLWPRA